MLGVKPHTSYTTHYDDLSPQPPPKSLNLHIHICLPADLLNIYFVGVWMFCLHVYLNTMFVAGAHGRQKTSDPLKLVTDVVSHHVVGTELRTFGREVSALNR